MLKVNQTKFGKGKGNCFSTCICCLLEIQDPDSIPNFVVEFPYNWYLEAYEWIKEHHNKELIIDIDSVDDFKIKKILSGQCSHDIKSPIILGCSTPNNIGHAVVYCPDNTIWDPNPNYKELIDVYYLAYLK